MSYEQFGVSNPYYANNNGNYSFSGAGSYSSGDPIVDYVLGIPDSYQQASGSFIQAIGHEYYVYAQDGWKVSNDLTLNYGIAWDTEAPYQNHQFNGLGIVCWAPGGTQTSKVYPGGPSGANLFPGSWLQHRGRCHCEIQSLWAASRFCLVAKLRPCQFAGRRRLA